MIILGAGGNMMKENQLEENVKNKKLELMIIDDNPDDRTLAIRELMKHFYDISVIEIINRTEFEEALDKGDFDIIITDYRLRWTTGLDILKEVKSKYPDIPVIMFTGTGTEEIAVEAMKRGLDDYVVKSPKHFMRLPVSVKKAIERREEQKKAEEAVKRSELKYKAIFENTGTNSFIIDNNGTIEIVNNQFERMSGYTRDEIKEGVTWRDLIVKTDHDKFEEFIEISKEDKTGSPEYFSICFVNRYNDKRNVLASLNRIPETDKMVCSMLDITKYKETVDALTTSEEMFRVAFENSPIGIMLLSLDEKILEVNQSVCEILGLSERTLIEGDCKDFIHVDDFKRLKEELDKLKKGGKKKSKMTIRFDLEDKESTRSNLVSSIVRDPKGKSLYYLIHIYE